jgi:hypothetical protein
MKFVLEINCDNAAFGPDYDARNDEVARILDDLATRLSFGHVPDTLRDINGNKVGTCEFKGEKS